MNHGRNLTFPRLVAVIESEELALWFAVLIDADNAKASVIEDLLAEIELFGELQPNVIVATSYP